MKNMTYCLLIILILINIRNINSKKIGFDIYHPLKLQTDFSNIPDNDNNNIKLLIREANEIISK